MNERDDLMKKILHDLYLGRIPGWDSYIQMNSETDETREKIRSERRYFASIMSAKDFERFEALEALHGEGHARRYKNTYTNAFKLGVMLMCAVFMNDDQEI